MEVYTLDDLLRREHVVDKFDSLIWTERFSSYGDFELVLPTTQKHKALFTSGRKLACNRSHRVMTVESFETSTDSDGRDTMTVKGSSIEKILEDRVAKDSMSNLTVEPEWVLTGTPGAILRQMFNEICVLGHLHSGDIIPFITTGSMFPASTIAEPDGVITWRQKPVQLYKAIKELCDIYDLGFRLVRNFDNSQLFFNIYSGIDRTTLQQTLPPVIFSLNMDNLQNTTEYTTTEDEKNVAYVFSEDGFAIVLADTALTNSTGFERKVLMVDASNIKAADVTNLQEALEQRGREELSKYRKIIAFDGEINMSSEYQYGKDYELGDMVEMRDTDGIISNRRVTEQIFVADQEGERTYPTLTTNAIVNPGSWLSYGYGTTEWDDFTTETWPDM